MNRTLLVLGFLGTLLFPLPASAHILKTDGQIGAILHVDPDDDPFIGQPASLYFELKDTSGQFSAANCTCQVDIATDGKSLVKQPGTPSTTNGIGFSYTFPSAGVYTLTLTGQPVTPGAFQPFTLVYAQRVAREAVDQSSSKSILSYLPYILEGLVAVVVVVYLVLSSRSKPTK